jgi:hypothetical protein
MSKFIVMAFVPLVLAATPALADVSPEVMAKINALTNEGNALRDAVRDDCYRNDAQVEAWKAKNAAFKAKLNALDPLVESVIADAWRLGRLDGLYNQIWDAIDNLKNRPCPPPAKPVTPPAPPPHAPPPPPPDNADAKAQATFEALRKAMTDYRDAIRKQPCELPWMNGVFLTARAQYAADIDSLQSRAPTFMAEGASWRIQRLDTLLGDFTTAIADLKKRPCPMATPSVAMPALHPPAPIKPPPPLPPLPTTQSR